MSLIVHSRYTTEVYLNVVRKYDVDGIHLDQVRYYEGDPLRWGYNPTSVVRFDERYGRDPGTHVVVLRAEGRGFCAGVDIKEIQRSTGHDALIGANRGCYAAFGAVTAPYWDDGYYDYGYGAYDCGPEVITYGGWGGGYVSDACYY